MYEHLTLKPLSATFKKTITNTVTSLPSIPSGTLRAWIQIETANIRARFDATTSMTGGAGAGYYMSTATCDYVIDGWDTLNRMRMHRDAAADAYINVVYFGAEQP